jgi:hypothetical protein
MKMLSMLLPLLCFLVNVPKTNAFSQTYNTFKANIRFQGVSFSKGLNHIHSLEHVATTHSLGVPFFQIRETSPPYMQDGVVCLNSTCSVLHLKPMKVIFQSKHVNTNEMSFLSMEDEKFLIIHLKVFPCLRDAKSHLFQIEIFPQFQIPQWLGKLYMWAIKCISANEDALFYFSGKKKFPILANCQKYRKMVFSKKK